MTTTTSLRLRFLADPAEFLTVAGRRLEAEPVVSTVVASVTERLVRQREAGIAVPSHLWWVVAEDAGEVVGVGMRTARTAPYPVFLLPQPEEAAQLLARTLHERGEEVVAVNGALPTAQTFAEETARLAGGRVEVAQHTRLHELGELVEPRPVPGRLVPVGEPDLGLAREWVEAFMGDADEQAGRPRGASGHEVPEEPEMLRRIRAGEWWFWRDADGTPVHLTCHAAPAFGVARVGPVYTPPEQRGRGWASAAVFAVSRMLRDQGVRVCLYTDQANPTSNRIYAALGYRPLVDMVNLVVRD